MIPSPPFHTAFERMRSTRSLARMGAVELLRKQPPQELDESVLEAAVEGNQPLVVDFLLHECKVARLKSLAHYYRLQPSDWVVGKFLTLASNGVPGKTLLHVKVKDPTSLILQHLPVAQQPSNRGALLERSMVWPSLAAVCLCPSTLASDVPPRLVKARTITLNLFRSKGLIMYTQLVVDDQEYPWVSPVTAEQVFFRINVY